MRWNTPSTSHDLQFGLRHSADYPFSNLYLFVKLEYPNGRTLTDTLECPLAAPTGEWYGEGGRWIDQRIGYKRGVAFPLAGAYSLKWCTPCAATPFPGWPKCGLPSSTVRPIESLCCWQSRRGVHRHGFSGVFPIVEPAA